MLRQTIRLHMNEMPYPPPQHVVEAARRALARLNRYADAEDLAQLRHLLGEYADVPQEQVIVGPGSDILLREMIHAFARERKVVTLSPSFLPTVEAARETATSWIGLRLSPRTPSMGRGSDQAASAMEKVSAAASAMEKISAAASAIEKVSAAASACEASEAAFTLQPELLLAEASEPCLVIIDNPNNPTGQIVLDRQTVRAVLENEQALLVVDEAYHEFARMSAEENGGKAGSFVDLVDDYANLAVTRTMDKAFNLAGARVGYAVIGEAFRSVFTSFYPILPQPSLYAAREALEHPTYVEQNVGRLIQERERLRETLQDLGTCVYPSHTNFLLVRTQVPDMAVRLRDSGVLISDVSNQLPSGFIRVSVGTRHENDVFLAAFKQIREENVRI